MLVLTRRENQSVLINKEVKVVVLEVIGNTVKLGIQAPGSMDIVRTELLELNQDRCTTQA